MPDLPHDPNRLNIEFGLDDLNGNAALLATYFFGTPNEEQVADTLESFSIQVGHEQEITAIGPGKYKSALLLMFLVKKYGNKDAGTLTVSEDTVEEAMHFFGSEIVVNARRPDTKHRTARFLLFNPGAEVTLKFKSKTAASAA